MPGGEIWKQVMLNLPAPFPELAERNFYIPSSWDEFDNITKYHVLEKGSIYFDFYIQSTFNVMSYFYLISGNPHSDVRKLGSG